LADGGVVLFIDRSRELLMVHYRSEVLLPDQAPASRKSRAKRAAHENVVIQIPDRCLTRASIVKEIVRLPVAIKVGSSYQRPATGQSRPKSASNEG
jgi:hypothetical protein